MRIAMLSRDLPPVASGMGDYASILAGHLRAKGATVDIYCDASVPTSAAGAAGATGATGAAGSHPSITRWDSPGVDAIVNELRRARPDVIVWQYNPFQIGSHGVFVGCRSLAKKLRRVAPVVLIAHELWYPWGRNGVRGFVWAASQRLQFVLMQKHFRAIIVTTQRRRRIVATYFPRLRPRLAYVPIGSNVRRGDAEYDEVRARIGLSSSDFVVGHFGSTGDGRNVESLIAACTSLRAEGLPISLLFVGRTGAQTPSESWIYASGEVAEDAVSPYLRACDAYAFVEPVGPTSRKGSLLAALDHELPVVAFDGAHTERLFRESGAVLLVQPNSRSLAAGLKRILQEPETRRQLREGARSLVDTTYDWKKITAEIFTILQASTRQSKSK